jgi:Carboxypeptidase regulatory-like domain/TonB-dependent Receptor Plug Domain
MTPKSFKFGKGRFRGIASVLMLLALLFGPGSAFATLAAAQEVTGNIQGDVKDQSGAVVPNATITATSGQRTLTTTSDSEGRYRFNNLQPGVYILSLTAAGFSDLKRDNVTVEIGKTLQVNFDIVPVGTKESVTVTASQEPIVDVTSSKTATNLSREKIDSLPKADLRFASVIDVAPGARNEPRSGQFQIDGASGAENVFIVDGTEVTRVFGGTLGSSKNLPVDFLQEVQIKTGGYEAEFGGATGGVVNVVTKGGTNQFHGQIRLEYTSDTFRGHDNPTLRLSPFDPAQQTIDYFNNPKGKDNSRFLNPNFLLNGPIIKDKLWFSIGAAPEYFKTTRTVYQIKPIAAGDTAVQVLNSRPITFRQKNDYNYIRLDSQPTSKLSVYGNFIHTPVQTEGILGFGSFTTGFLTTSASTLNNPRYDFQGGYTPSWQTSFGANYSITSRFIVSFRGGVTYLNDKGGNYDIPQNTPNLIISVPCTSTSNNAGASNCTPFTTATGSNIVTNQTTSFDITRRTNLNVDATYIANFFGQHTFKGGYQINRISNDVLFGFSGGRFQFLFGRARNEPDPNNPARVIPVRGTYGYYVRDEFARSGNVSGRNQGFFLQDAWQIHRRVTLNVGVRIENEFLPSYPISRAGHPDIPEGIVASSRPVDFGWGDKIAPRIGGAWDVFGDGRLKVSASYSVFFDTMKYGLARGSFGGEVFLRSFCKLNTSDVSGFTLSTPCDIFEGPGDLRFPSNVNLPGERPGIDPNLKPYREHEYSATAEYALGRDLVFGARFTRKSLDRAIEDIGGVDAAGNEFFTIGNPGFGTAVSDFNPPTPKAIRRYTAFEVRVDKRFTNHWYANGSYTWSRLFGNYSGLASSDENGRTDTNTNRDFDLPFLNFKPNSSGGGLETGPLQTDRPNTFKFFGGYRTDYSMFNRTMGSDINIGERIYQGIPLTTEVPTVVVAGSGANAFLGGRGNAGRTPWFTQTDLLFTQRVRITEGSSLLFRVNVTNLFDERNVVEQFRVLLGPGQSLRYPTTDAFLNGNYQQDIVKQNLVTDPRYLKASLFQNPREARFAVGFEW